MRQRLLPSALAITLALSSWAVVPQRLFSQQQTEKKGTYYTTYSDRDLWLLIYHHHNKSYSLITSDSLYRWVDSLSRVYDGDKWMPKQLTRIRDLYSRLAVRGAGIVEFVRATEPLLLNEHHKGKMYLMASGLVTSETINIKSVTLEQRVGQIVASKILPLLESFNASFATAKEISGYAIHVTYGTTDPGAKEYKRIEPEAVMLFVSKSDCKAYVENKLSVAELLKRSDVMVNIRDRTEDGYFKVNAELPAGN